MKQEVNIYEVAKLSGVSIATVSRVVNGSAKVSEATRKRVTAVIEEVGFTPNVFARGLGIKTMHTVGILVPTISDPYMSEAVSFLEDALSGNGYECLLSCSGYELAGKQRQTASLLAKHIDALILVGSTYAGAGSEPSETDYIREAAKQVPVFMINGSAEGENIYSAICDDEAAVCDAARLLISRGYRKIAFLTDSDSYSAIRKRSGYRRALEEKHMTPLELQVEKNVQRVRDCLLEQTELYFDAVITTCDTLAAGVVKYALRAGRRIPEDVAVIGYDNSSLAAVCEPELSGIDNHTEQICRESVDRLLKLLSEGPAGIKQNVLVPCELIERGTS